MRRNIEWKHPTRPREPFATLCRKHLTQEDIEEASACDQEIVIADNPLLCDDCVNEIKRVIKE